MCQTTICAGDLSQTAQKRYPSLWPCSARPRECLGLDRRLRSRSDWLARVEVARCFCPWLEAVVLLLAKVSGILQFSFVRYSTEPKVSEACVRWEIEDRPAYLCVRESRRERGERGRKYVFICQWERLFSVIQGDFVWAPQPVCFVSCPWAGLQFLLDSLRGPVWF